MKVAVIALLIFAIPMMAFAQEYIISLKSLKQPVRCELLGTHNGHVYYKTADTPMVVMPIASVESLYLGTKDITADLHLSSFPFTSEALALFPPDQAHGTTGQNTDLILMQQKEELRGIKGATQLIAAISLFAFAASVYFGATSK